MYKKLIVYTDGGSRGNPGPSAAGIYITNELGEQVYARGVVIGIATNNIAEYKAILFAITWVCEQKNNLAEDAQIHFFMDSNLAYSQLVGLYKIKNPILKELLIEIHKKEQEIGRKVSYAHIPREKNKKADALVNMALDNTS